MNVRKIIESVQSYAAFSFARSSGNGGQNVNKVNTKVYAFVEVGRLEGMSDEERMLLRDRLRGRINSEGLLYVCAQEGRSRELNRRTALRRLSELICGAATVPRRRKRTVPGRAAEERRLKQKKLRSKLKRSRTMDWEG